MRGPRAGGCPLTGEDPGLGDDRHARRPNYLATVSVLLGSVTLTAQVLGPCLFYVWGFVLAVPTAVGLLVAWFGMRQARQTGVGLETAVVGLTLALSNLALSFVWLSLTAIYAFVVVFVVVIAMLA